MHAEASGRGSLKGSERELEHEPATDDTVAPRGDCDECDIPHTVQVNRSCSVHENKGRRTHRNGSRRSGSMGIVGHGGSKSTFDLWNTLVHVINETCGSHPVSRV